MAFARIIPVLLLQNHGLVKTTRFRDPVYVGDPVNAIRIFNDKEADELILLDIEMSAKNTEPDYEFLHQAAAECFMPLSYGGGIKSLNTIRKIIQCGIEKVVLNSAVLQDVAFLKSAAQAFGSSTIIASIDIKKNIFGTNKVYHHVTKKITNINPKDYAKILEENGAGEIFLNNVDKDGTMKGYDIPILKEITSAVSIPVIACGGGASLEDMRLALTEGGASASAAGSLFVFHGPHRGVLISYPTSQEIENVVRSQS